ncbi:hypothetical protein HY490_02710 [Candidatus Woesearchaeota archaeon]|nr:hypothetical protein [Candidatus Woesearchaeota archaeon]
MAVGEAVSKVASGFAEKAREKAVEKGTEFAAAAAQRAVEKGAAFAQGKVAQFTAPSRGPPLPPVAFPSNVITHEASFSEHRPKQGEFMVFVLVLIVSLLAVLFVENPLVQRLVIIAIAGLLFAERFLGEKFEQKFNIKAESADPLMLLKLLAAVMIVVFVNNIFTGIVLVIVFFLIVLYGPQAVHWMQDRVREIKGTKEGAKALVAVPEEEKPKLLRASFWPKWFFALIICDGLIDNTVGRIPGVEMIVEVVLALIAYFLWGKAALLQLLELLDPTGFLDPFIPGVAGAGLAARHHAMKEWEAKHPQPKTQSAMIFLLFIAVGVVVGGLVYMGLTGVFVAMIAGGGLLFAVLAMYKPDVGLALMRTVGLLVGYFLLLFFLLMFNAPSGLVAIIALVAPIAMLVVDAKAGVLVFSFVLLVGFYAYAYGSPVPSDSPLGGVITAISGGIAKGFSKAAAGPQYLEQAFKRQIAIASGDFAASQIDAEAKRDLGVSLQPLKKSEERFFTTAPAAFFTTLKGTALDKPIEIKAECEFQTGSDPPAPAKILSRCANDPRQDTFCMLTVEGEESYDIDCTTGEPPAAGEPVLVPGSHTIRLRAAFGFTARSYLPMYLMEQGKLRDMRRRNLDPLEGFDVKSPVATTTKGPVRVGIAVGTQPVGIELAAGKPGPTIAVTIDNAGAGEVAEVTNVLLFMPKGLTVAQLAGGRALGEPAKKTCTELRDDPQVKEEAKLCDDKIHNAYLISPRQRGTEPLGSFVTFRAYTQVEDGNTLLGPAAVTTRNIRVSTTYKYLLKQETVFTVEEPRQAFEREGEIQQVLPAEREP